MFFVIASFALIYGPTLAEAKKDARPFKGSLTGTATATTGGKEEEKPKEEAKLAAKGDPIPLPIPRPGQSYDIYGTFNATHMGKGEFSGNLSTVDCRTACVLAHKQCLRDADAGTLLSV